MNAAQRGTTSKVAGCMAPRATSRRTLSVPLPSFLLYICRDLLLTRCGQVRPVPFPGDGWQVGMLLLLSVGHDLSVFYYVATHLAASKKNACDYMETLAPALAFGVGCNM